MFDSELSTAFSELPLWNQLNTGEKETLLQNAKIESYHKGERIIHTAEGCKGPIVVLSGQIRTYILSDEGREVTLYRLSKGDMCALSASCILNSIAFDVIIEASEETNVIVIPVQVFNTMQQKNPQLELYLLRIANERFSDVMWTLQQILFMGADRRVAIFLWDEMTKTGSKELCITHDEIAKYISSAREVVTRVLKYFAKEGIVNLSRGKIEITDKEKLKALV